MKKSAILPLCHAMAAIANEFCLFSRGPFGAG
jgi:hypothetical protein